MREDNLLLIILREKNRYNLQERRFTTVEIRMRFPKMY